MLEFDLTNWPVWVIITAWFLITFRKELVVGLKGLGIFLPSAMREHFKFKAERTRDREEFDQKQNRIQELLAQNKVDGLLLQRASSFAWATCGAASYINTASTEGLASLLVTANGRYLITTNIEATRLEQEEGLVAQGWELKAAPWYETQDEVFQLVNAGRLAVDGLYPGALDLSAQVTALRTDLTQEEVAEKVGKSRPAVANTLRMHQQRGNCECLAELCSLACIRNLRVMHIVLEPSQQDDRPLSGRLHDRTFGSPSEQPTTALS